LQQGASADVLVFSRDLQLKRVLVEGEELDLSDA
jgi:N-acetylglucosamine-6-phosphate deacetylase